ncbi:MAG: hypothetical protein GXP08_04310 [Gammaproteobacteria bacterium]|nr:hypothetical protein [Gammaproteobacteria bacterium]
MGNLLSLDRGNLKVRGYFGAYLIEGIRVSLRFANPRSTALALMASTWCQFNPSSLRASSTLRAAFKTRTAKASAT